MPPFDNGFEAWVEVDGDRLQEFEVEEFQNERRAPVLGCWIPSVSGKEFKIGFKLPKGRVKKYHHSFTVHVDGEIMEVLTGFVEKDRNISEDIVVKFGEELTSDGKATRNFRFGTLEVTDNDSDIGLQHDDLGEIEVCLSSVSKFVRNQTRCGASKCGTARKTGRIHESQKKKGLTHSVQLGEEKEYDGSQLDAVKYVGHADVCSFQFWYRDISALIAEGKAPGKNTPVPIASSSSNAPTTGGHVPSRGSNGHLDAWQHEAPLDENGGLEYVTPEPAPQRDQVTTVPSAAHVSTNGPPAAEESGIQREGTAVAAKGSSSGPSKKGPRTREPARTEDRDAQSSGRVLRSQTLSGSATAHPSPSTSRRSNLPLNHTPAPQAPPAPGPVRKSGAPIEVIEISDDDESLVPVKVEESESVKPVKGEVDTELNINQNLREMTIEGEGIGEPTRLTRRGPSVPATRKAGGATSIDTLANSRGKKQHSEDIEMSDEEEEGSEASVHDSEIEAWQNAAEALTHLAKLKSKRRLSEKRAGHDERPPKRVKTGKPLRT